MKRQSQAFRLGLQRQLNVGLCIRELWRVLGIVMAVCDSEGIHLQIMHASVHRSWLRREGDTHLDVDAGALSLGLRVRNCECGSLRLCVACESNISATRLLLATIPRAMVIPN